jgi:hypothetical protein
MVMEEGFRFEADFMEDGMRCIPMAARLRLDLCGIKLRLSEWSKMTDIEKRKVATWPYDLPGQMAACHDYLKGIVYRRTGREATVLDTTGPNPWADTSRVPEAVEIKMTEYNWTLSLEEWRSLTGLQRFALVKLTRPGHENRNFPRAVLEFRHRQLVPVL